jgi:hypothetical protein
MQVRIRKPPASAPMCPRGTGLDVWFDKDDLQPGEPRTAALENAVVALWP